MHERHRARPGSSPAPPQQPVRPTERPPSPPHTQCSIAFHEPYLQLIERLLPMMPHPSLDSFFFWNSGSEAIEATIKLARTATGRQNIIAMQGGYHGRTYGTMAVTKSKTIYSEGFHPLMVGAPSIGTYESSEACFIHSPACSRYRSRTGTISVCPRPPHPRS